MNICLVRFAHWCRGSQRTFVHFHPLWWFTVLEAYGHAPGSASRIAPIARSFSISYSRFCHRSKLIGRSLCLNGLSTPVFIVCTTTEVRPKSIYNTENASMFCFKSSTNCFRIYSGIGSVYNNNQRSASTFWNFPVCCLRLGLGSTVSGLILTVSGSSSICFCSCPSVSGRVAKKLAPILQQFLRRVDLPSDLDLPLRVRLGTQSPYQFLRTPRATFAKCQVVEVLVLFYFVKMFKNYLNEHEINKGFW